jgi:hypothetical protein
MERPSRPWAAVLCGVAAVLLCRPAAGWLTFVNAVPNANGEAREVTSDATGDVLAVGTVLDFTVAKLDGATGWEIWRQTVTGTDTASGQGRAILWSPSPAAVVVGGSVSNIGTGQDFFVARLSTLDGSEVWRYERNGTSGTGDEAIALARLDGGDVVAAGRLDNSGTNWDFAVVRLAAADGAELWRYERNGAGNGSEQAVAVSVDLSGDVVAVGFLRNTGSAEDLAVVKLEGATGAELWRREITGSAAGTDQAYSVAIDASGDVLVAGFVTNAGTGRDLIVLKLSGSNGTTIWRYEVDGGVSAGDQAVAVATADGARVFAAGRLEGSDGADLAVVALNGVNGSPLRTYRLDGPASAFDDAQDLVVEPDGDPVVVGHMTNPVTGKDLVTARLAASDGSEVWRQVINGNADLEDEGFSVAAEPGGRVFVGAAMWRLIRLGAIKKKDPSREFAVLQMDGASGAEVRLLTGKRFRLTERQVTTRVARFSTVSRDQDSIVPPPIGSPSDPRPTAVGGSGAGGEIVIRNPSTGEIDRLPLPAENWEVLGPFRNPKGYRYLDKDGSKGPCRSVIVRAGQALRAKCPRPGIDFTLDEPSQVALSAALVMGQTPVGYCVHFGGEILEDLRRSGRFNRGSFRARNAPIPPECTMPVP